MKAFEKRCRQLNSLNETPKGERIHISIFGRRNAGKSSIINAITGQSLAIVSDVLGTTTDPVQKAMELLPLGPVVITDTPGLDDVGELGLERVKKAYSVLAKTDIALIITDGIVGMGEVEKNLEAELKSRTIPYLIVYNKSDLSPATDLPDGAIAVSALTGDGINALKEKIASLAPKKEERDLLDGIVKSGDTVLLVIPIDSAAPKGRLILPQQQTIRSILDKGAHALICRDSELKSFLSLLGKEPDLVICDSQVFKAVQNIIPKSVPLTSFSILFARYKGDLKTLVNGVKALKGLKDGDSILIAEGCTHHRQCGDIGSVKIPAMLEKFTGIKPEYHFTSGVEFTENPENFKLIIHCGGCMLSEKEMKNRLAIANGKNVPIVNFGVLLAYLSGILERSLEPFGEDI